MGFPSENHLQIVVVCYIYLSLQKLHHPFEDGHALHAEVAELRPLRRLVS